MKAGRSWGVSFDAMALGMLLVVFCAAAALMPAQNDTFWNLRAGADIWRTGHIPRTDSYSHTFFGAPWPDHEWLAQVLMYGVYQLGGMPGLTFAWALAIWGVIAIVYRLMVGPPQARLLPLALGLMICCCVWALRPQVLTLLALATLTWMLVRERLWPIPILFVAWANAHGAVMLGLLVLLGAWAAAALRWWRRRERTDARRLRALSVIVPLVGLAIAATPLGFGIYRFVFASTDRIFAININEWFPTWPNDLVGVLFWIGALGLAAALIHRRHMLADADWPTWALVAGVLALAPLAVRAVRNVAPFVVLAIPAASRVLGPEFRIRRRRDQAPAGADHPLLNLGLLVGVGVLAAALVVGAWLVPARSLGWHPIPAAAVRAIESCPGPLYHHYSNGGFLIWFTPGKPVFVDGRQDPYPVPFVVENLEVEAGRKPYRPVFARWGIRCAFLNAASPTVQALGADGWRRRFADDDWVVFEAPGQ